jgi:hypothetical protein
MWEPLLCPKVLISSMSSFQKKLKSWIYYGAHLNIVQTCSPVQCLYLPHVQTQNITFCYNKQGIISKAIHILQYKRPVGDIIWHNPTHIYKYNADIRRLEVKIQKITLWTIAFCSLRLHFHVDGRDVLWTEAWSVDGRLVSTAKQGYHSRSTKVETWSNWRQDI